MKNEKNDVPIMPNGNGFFNLFVLEDINEIFCQEGVEVLLLIFGVVGPSVPQHVWSDDSESFLLEEGDLVVPVKPMSRESVSE